MSPRLLLLLLVLVLVLVLGLVLGCAPTPSPSPSATPAASAAPDAATNAEKKASPAEQAVVVALKKADKELDACHRASKNAVGDMTIRVVIGVNGKVEATAIEPNPTVPPALVSCIEKHVRALRVEISPVTVPIPFHFRTSPYDGPTIRYGSGPFDPGY